MTAQPNDVDEEEIEQVLEEFFDEHGREPYNSEEFVRWYARCQVRQAEQMTAQVEAQGLEITKDGRIVPKVKK